MWLVLCPATDLAALWVYQGLKAYGLTPLELVSAEMLAFSLHWEHRLGADGVSIRITLADGREIRSDTTRGILNRLSFVAPGHLHMASPADRDYATQELTAFFMSWLYALPQPVLNRPTPQGLAGQWRHVSEWVWLASQVGLPTGGYRQTSNDAVDEVGFERKLISPGTPVNTVFVVQGHVVSAPAPQEIREGCRRLGKLAGTELLGVEFAAGAEGPWTFAGATPLPDLSLGGRMLLDVLAQVLRGERI